MSEKRKPITKDQQNAERCFQMLSSYLGGYPEIEGVFWVGALLTITIRKYHESGLTYEEFCVEWDGIKNHYKYIWDK
jgi:hypothetical protein